jgi:predicted amidohydrolase YtcJ
MGMPLCVNSKVLAMANITKDTKKVSGGEIKTEAYRILIDNPMELVLVLSKPVVKHKLPLY